MFLKHGVTSGPLACMVRSESHSGDAQNAREVRASDEEFAATAATSEEEEEEEENDIELVQGCKDDIIFGLSIDRTCWSFLL